MGAGIAAAIVGVEFLFAFLHGQNYPMYRPRDFFFALLQHVLIFCGVVPLLVIDGGIFLGCDASFYQCVPSHGRGDSATYALGDFSI